MIDSPEPRTLALNWTNIALGIGVLFVCLPILYGIVGDLIDKLFQRKSDAPSIDDRAPRKSTPALTALEPSSAHIETDFGDSTLAFRTSCLPENNGTDRHRLSG